MREEVASTELPGPDDWPDLDAAERERRARVLARIARRIAEDGPHRAYASPERGRQFIPFAALKGYGEMLARTEAEAAGAAGTDTGAGDRDSSLRGDAPG